MDVSVKVAALAARLSKSGNLGYMLSKKKLLVIDTSSWKTVRKRSQPPSITKLLDEVEYSKSLMKTADSAR